MTLEASRNINMWRQPLYEISTTQKETLGAKRPEPDGTTYRYAQVGAVALAAGVSLMSMAAAANHINQAPHAAFAIGVTEITMDVGATAVTLDQYADGFLQCNAGAGVIGEQYRIVGNTACDASGFTTITLSEPLRAALVIATSKLSLIPNPWKGLVITTGAGVLFAGVSTQIVAAAKYVWVQSGGVANALAGAANAVGQQVFPAADGKLDAGPNTTTGSPLAAGPPVGIAFATAGVNGECKPVLLTVD